MAIPLPDQAPHPVTPDVAAEGTAPADTEAATFLIPETAVVTQSNAPEVSRRRLSHAFTTARETVKASVEAERAALWIHPSRVYFRGTRLGHVFTAAYEDIEKSDNKRRDAAWAVGALATQAIDRTRWVTVLAPEVAINVMEETQNSYLTGAVAAAIFAAWNGTMGAALNKAMSRIPGGLAEFKDKFPWIVNTFSKSLPGIEVTPQEKGEAKTLANEDAEPDVALVKPDSLIKRGFMRFRRGLSGIGLGSTAFVATTRVNGGDEQKGAKANRGVTADTSAVIFGVGFGISETIKRLVANGNYEAADRIMDVVGGKYTWYIVAAGSIAIELASTSLAKRKELAKDEDQNESGNRVAADEAPLQAIDS